MRHQRPHLGDAAGSLGSVCGSIPCLGLTWGCSPSRDCAGGKVGTGEGDQHYGMCCEPCTGLLWLCAPGPEGCCGLGSSTHASPQSTVEEQSAEERVPSGAVALLVWHLYNRDGERGWGAAGSHGLDCSSSFMSWQLYAVDGHISPQSCMDFNCSLRQRWGGCGGL